MALITQCVVRKLRFKVQYRRRMDCSIGTPCGRMSEAPVPHTTDNSGAPFGSHGASEESKASSDAMGGQAMPAASASITKSSLGESSAIQPTQLFVPSLRGKMLREGSAVICRGRWAMTDAQHSSEDLTSDYEFKLVTPTDAAQLASSTVAVEGIYQGWFKLKKNLPMKGYDKVEDRAINISLEAKGAGEVIGDGTFNANADMRVTGKGRNKFGDFTLKGSLNSTTGDILMYREYIPKPVKVRTKTTRKVDVDPNAPVVPREGAGRVRKASTMIQEFDTSLQPPLKQPKGHALSREEQKVQKLSLQLQSCLTVLEEIAARPVAQFFLEPVDPIKLNIPDYALVITDPMDISTVRSNLANEVYKTPQEFAEHMRLIWKNAIAYNAAKDNPVHIAARECARMFEEKYRTAVGSFSNSSRKRLNPVVKKKGPTDYGGGMRFFDPSSAGAFAAAAAAVAASKGEVAAIEEEDTGPAPPNLALPPDGSLVQMQEMQMKMMQMQNELLSLRSAVAQEQIKEQLDIKQADSQNPLTYTEKTELIDSIHKLPPDDMEKVVLIVQEAAPSKGGGDDDDIEVPLDELDTHTLRKLQRYVESVKARQMRRM